MIQFISSASTGKMGARLAVAWTGDDGVGGGRRPGVGGGMATVSPGRPGDSAWSMDGDDAMQPQNVFISNGSAVSSRRQYGIDGEDGGLSSAAVGVNASTVGW